MKRTLLLTLVLAFAALAGLLHLLQPAAAAAAPTAVTPCTNGMAGPYPCHNVNLLAHLPLADIGGGGALGNDHWGWTDPASGRDYVIFGLTDGTSFIDITDRQNPVFLGKLPAHVPGESSTWWDIKVYADHAFIVGDIPSTNGLQIFDLTQLAAVASPPVTFTETAHVDSFGPAHNLWVNAETGFLYVMRTDVCPMIAIFDVSTPTLPIPAGPTDATYGANCLVDEADDPIVSDAECIVYDGPDADYAGREICFVGSDGTLSIVDVTDKAAPAVLTNTLAYTENPVARLHQGALTADRRHWLVSDVMDEMMYGYNTRTYVWDVADLDAPAYLGHYDAATTARDHNLYFVGDIMFQANWRAGLRILHAGALPDLNFVELGYFDIVPGSDSPAASGAWSNVPWWPDGVVTVSGTDEGLFILQPAWPQVYLPLIKQ